MVRRWYPARRTTPAVFRAPSRVAFLPRVRGRFWLPVAKSLSLGSIVGSGGGVGGGSAATAFVHGGGSVASDVIVEWDFDNDGNFDQPVEDITSKVMSLETFAGRDFPSQLTGTAGPGRFRGTLNNELDEFNYFQTASPLNQPPFSLSTGRKLRLRTSDAASPDPVLLALDRFRRADSTSLGSADPGGAWTQPLTDDFEITSQHAVPTSEGDPHLAYLDLGAADYYLQVLIAGMGSLTNRVGIAYRYVDNDDYSIAVIDAAAQAVQVINVVAGVETIVASVPTEVYSGATLGVLLDDDEVTVYLEGAPLVSAVAINTSSELAGIYATWGTGDTAPLIDNVWAWDGLGSTVEGILWTGDAVDLVPSVLPGPLKVASLTGEGWLGKMASQDVVPPTSVVGRRTGRLVGAVLAECGLLHPPGPVDLGEVTTGPFAMASAAALAVGRDIEEAEFGFLYESAEGPIGFDSRIARDGSVALATFSDAPGAQFGYESISPIDQRKQIFNRVSAGVSPYVLGLEQVLYVDPGPYILAPGESVQLAASYSGSDGIVTRWTGHTRDVSAPSAPTGITITTDVEAVPADDQLVFTLPTTAAGDLLLLTICTDFIDGDTPFGWTRLSPAGTTHDKGAVYGRIAEGDEATDTFEITLQTGIAQPWVAQLYRITSWFGNLAGVVVAQAVIHGAGAVPNPPAITPPWGAVPTLFIACAGNSDANTSGTPSVSSGPSLYGNLTFAGAATSNYDPWLATARRVAEVTSENPGTFTTNGAAVNVSGSLSWTIAVRGTTTPTPVSADTPAGTNGVFVVAYDDAIGGDFQSHTDISVTGILLERGDDVTVQAEDVVSQERHRAIRTYRTGASLFANPTDALLYADQVLTRHSTDRPIFAISFTANKSAAYRAQALRRRVSDRIHLVANHTSGLGVEADFFIENIGHIVSNGTTLWRVVWELSPAPT